MGYGQIFLSKRVSVELLYWMGKAPVLAGAFVLYINYRKMSKTNPPTFEKNYLVCYEPVVELSTDLGA
jgi:hypothetical protein